MYFDAHNHLQDAWLAPHRGRILADLAAAGVRAVVVNGTSESDWPDVAALCAAPPSSIADLRAPISAHDVRLLPSFGLHPWDAGNRTPDWQRALLAHLDAPRPPSVHSAPPTSPHLRTPISDLRAHRAPFIGEIGLDRWILDRARPDDPRLAGLRRASLEEQREVFLWQLELTATRDLPVTIHCIDAYGPLLDALAATRRPARGFLLHAYAGSAEMVKRFADLGAYFSFNGYFLDPRRARRLRPVYAAVPPDRLLVETDAPAMPLPADVATHPLPPAPDGSPVNHPANLVAAYTGLARWLDLDPAPLAAQVEKNFHRFFLM